MFDRIDYARTLWELACLDLRGADCDLIADAQRRLEERADSNSLGRTPLLAHIALSETEELVLCLLAAVALDLATERFAAVMSGGGAPTLSVIRHVAYRSGDAARSLQELGPSGTLRRLRLIERNDIAATGTHESRHTWAIAQRVLDLVCSRESVDTELQRLRAARSTPVLEELTIVEPTVTEVCSAASRAGTLVVARGATGTGRRSLLHAAASSVGGHVLEIDAKRFDTGQDYVRQLKLIARECRLRDSAPLICDIDVLVDGNDQSRLDLIGTELVPEISGPIFLTCGPNRPAMRWGRPTIVVDVKPPTSAQRAQLWLRELGQGTQEDAEYLATQYPLAPALIHHAASAAKARANGRALQPDDIYQGIRAVLDDKLGDYAKRVEVTQSWADLVLPDDQREAIDYLIARIRQRRTVYEQWGFAAKVGKGLGTSALFSGPPGTGKTMVAALVAKELGLELYQVDMAKLVSKFIGETERNLAALFDAAEAGHAILLFDEADSLFGKRTDVKSSNDRYANLETNYLLQRLESFTGICLLTSNHESNIDPAFQRRLSLHLRFELPDVDERAALWRAMLPAAAPVAPNLDVQGLARRFAMSGGYIRNAALRAAFLAADEGSAITAAHLERAARLEYEGMGKLAA